ncbi:MAG: hypothetical protein U9M97_02645, partial [Candidatus Hadarchaeota archaeon]|nr:hypothetical protein [Candidatus Hadarchaeota archaeon]
MVTKANTTHSTSLHLSKTITARLFGRIVLYVIAIIGSIFFMAPFVWSLFSSLKPYNEIYVYPPTLFPEQWEWGNYATAT